MTAPINPKSAPTARTLVSTAKPETWAARRPLPKRRELRDDRSAGAGTVAPDRLGVSVTDFSFSTRTASRFNHAG